MTEHLLLATSRLLYRACFALPTTLLDGDGRRRSNAWRTVPAAYGTDRRRKRDRPGRGQRASRTEAHTSDSSQGR